MCRNFIVLFSIIFILKLCAINGQETNLNVEKMRKLLNSFQLGDTENTLDLLTKFVEYMDSQNQRIQVLETAVNKVNRIIDVLQLKMNFQVRENKKLKAEIARIVFKQKGNVKAEDHSIQLAVQENDKEKLEEDNDSKFDKNSEVDSQDTDIIETQSQKNEKIGQVENNDEKLKQQMTRSTMLKSDVLNSDQHAGTSHHQRQLNYQHTAFSAYLDHNLPHIGVGTTIKCNMILYNEGNGYNPVTGIFTAPTTGAYFLTFTIHSHHSLTDVRLVLDGQNIVGAVTHTTTSAENNMASNSAIIHVNSGQAVWLEQLNGDGELISLPEYRQVTFTGFLLA